ncbi:Oidioi.mRNA.OKI2018_I69.PAR.g8460.t1.cds [Oikopleura dioica]|uniref:Oidioi.mRNA.OKI2018_I69.PAR.g8460.t1.cds n=1 Tax=Oikopleura dioica TaxID=34765 RepID=A0ABN7RG13_OIKDI|nr:Oidioi.mRNA.OKI2018_I69.PAR.g8460.t1.cds [Oikopleura dioica]
MKLSKSSLFAAAFACPCQKIGEDGFGEVRPGNNHADQSFTKFYFHVDTPIGNEQIDDFKFVLKFGGDIESFTQYFAVDDFSDSTSNIVNITPGQNMISGDPYTFNFEALADSDELDVDVWFCPSVNSLDGEEDFSSCDEDNSSSQEPDHTEGPPTDFPEVSFPDLEWTEVAGRRVAVSSTPLSYKNARKTCRILGGSLPWPKTSEENELINSLGSTWLGFSIDDHVMMSFENFQPIKTRPFMNPNGFWSYGDMEVEKNFICVEEEIEGCPDVFGELSELNGNLMIRESREGSWMSFEDWPFQGFKARSQVQYSCPQKIKTYKKWRKASKKIQLTCVKMQNGQFDWAECNNKKCSSFNRCPWLDEPMKRQIDSMICQ